ncbi:MAG: hypothetical protein K2Y56_06250 [Methylobacterium sp.]|uniref:hypothetical protein n=1 Tax=Methylobacterium sp. TaxID=409 RepID=UPI0025CD8F72|nr:hypothetical protein [Methylobacterium sp.]MBX9931125.1 hypothetical protein [Methylobacterium sp.]
MKMLIVAILALPLSAAALAQSGNAPAEIRQPGPPSLTPPGTSSAPVEKPGGIDNGGPGSIGSMSRGPTGAGTISNNSGAAGNAEQNQKPIGNTGGGGTN